MKKTLVALLLVAFAPSYAQVIIRGKIVDEITNKSIPRATIRVNLSPLKSASDSAGAFLIRNVPKGNVELEISHPDYELSIVPVTLQNPITQLQVKLKKSTNKLATRSQREKIYLHTDKPYYYPGDIIWFAGHAIYSAPTNTDSASAIAYVDLIDANKKVIYKEIVPVEQGKLSGQIILKKDLPPGSYVLQCYTTYMMNFGEADIFYKSVPVLDMFESVESYEAAKETRDNSELVSIVADKTLYKPREKISLTLIVNADSANFSISVTDMQQVVPVSESTIYDHLSFNAPTEVRKADERLPLERGISFLGQFKNSKGKPAPATINFVRGQFDDFFIGQTDESGRVFVNGIHFYDSVTFYYRANKGDKAITGKLDIETLPQLQPPVPLPGYWFRTRREQSARHSIPTYLLPEGARMLEEVVVETKKFDPEENINRGRLGQPDYSLKMDQLTPLGNVAQSLIGKVPGLIINCSTTPCIVRYGRAMGGSFMGSGEPLVLVDGVPRAGAAGEVLGMLEFASIYKIEFTRRLNVLYGADGANGIIAVYTKNGVGIFEEAKSSKQFFKLRGYTTALPFKSPDYSKEISDNPDYRSTIYWNPKVTARTGKSSGVSFYAADVPTQYRIVVEGITSAGQPIRASKFITIQ